MKIKQLVFTNVQKGNIEKAIKILLKGSDLLNDDDDIYRVVSVISFRWSILKKEDKIDFFIKSQTQNLIVIALLNVLDRFC